MVSGSEDPSKEESSVRWDAVARSGGTIVVLMGWDALQGIADTLLSEGLAPSTPVALVRWGTEPYQRTVTGSLADIVQRGAEAGLSAPLVAVIGGVVDLREQLRWFDDRPLFGKRVLVTRSRNQASALSRILADEGAEPVELPTIQISPIEDNPPLDSAIASLGTYAWVIFTSANGVEAFFSRARTLGHDARAFAGVKVGAIGPATGKALEKQGIRADLMPTEYVAEALVQAMDAHYLTGAKVLLPRADIGRHDLAEGLAELDARVQQLPVYRTVMPQESRELALDLLKDGGIDLVTFTSSSTVNNLLDLLNGDGGLLGTPVVACIGPITAKTASGKGTAGGHRGPGIHSARAGAGHEGALRQRGGRLGWAGFPEIRLRRLRELEPLRALSRETQISISDFIYPIFVTHGRHVRREIESMPGCHQLSLDNLLAEVTEVSQLGIPAVILFGIPLTKDSLGQEAYDEHGIIQEAIRVIKQAVPQLLVVTDVCLCGYTDHGHCGVVDGGRVDNDATLELLARTALSHVDAGADVVAPSAMMDGQVKTLRTSLDEKGYREVPIIAYAAKYDSAFYGTFRTAAESAPQFGDRKGYQLDPANRRMAMREIEADIQEGGRHSDGEARPGLPGRNRHGQGEVRPPHRRLQRERRVLYGEGCRRQRLDRRAASDPGDTHRHKAGRGRHCGQLPRQRGGQVPQRCRWLTLPPP